MAAIQALIFGPAIAGLIIFLLCLIYDLIAVPYRILFKPEKPGKYAMAYIGGWETPNIDLFFVTIIYGAVAIGVGSYIMGPLPPPNPGSNYPIRPIVIQ
jgi:hypothetical protein